MITNSNRVLATPSTFAKSHYFYVQEAGTLKSIEPHISSRKNLASYLFLVVLSGEGFLTYHSHRYTLSAGNCAWVNCTQPYAHESSKEHPWELMWVHFYGKEADFYYSLYLEKEYTPIFTPVNISIFTNALDALYTCHKEHHSLTELLSNKYITDIITYSFTEHQVAKENSFSYKLSQIRDYIDLNFQNKISLDYLSKEFYVSKFHLSREFKRAYNITIGNYILSRRISNAKRLLRFTDDSIETVSIQCGIPEAGYFIKVFKKSEGMTPLEYRKKW